MQETDGMYSRFHLRVDRDGSGLLMANAAATARLSHTGVFIAKGLLDGKDENAILQDLAENFKGTSKAMMRADIDKVNNLITELINPHDAYPVFNLEDPALSPYSSALIAPLQAAVTLAEPERLVPILDQLWDVGIPNVTLIAPGTPDPDYLTRDFPIHLVRAVERAEDLGLIAGVRARASDLHDETLLADLVQAGLDHMTIFYASTDARIHDALFGDGDHASAVEVFNWLEANETCAIAQIPLVQSTLETLEATISKLMDLGADNLSFFALATAESDVKAARSGDLRRTEEGDRRRTEEGDRRRTETARSGDLRRTEEGDRRRTEGEDRRRTEEGDLRRTEEGGLQRAEAITADGLLQVASLVEETAYEVQARFIWEPPIQRNPAMPLVQQVREGPRCAGEVAIRVEPDGSVIPPRGPYQSAGNLLTDSWDTIWENEAFRMYRERVEAPTRCDRCPGLTICAADCPREPSGWAQYST
jgi:radical SAM protein with 4Fe4S-binding SPASM domain